MPGAAPRTKVPGLPAPWPVPAPGSAARPGPHPGQRSPPEMAVAARGRARGGTSARRAASPHRSARAGGGRARRDGAGTGEVQEQRGPGECPRAGGARGVLGDVELEEVGKTKDTGEEKDLMEERS